MSLLRVRFKSAAAAESFRCGFRGLECNHEAVAVEGSVTVDHNRSVSFPATSFVHWVSGVGRSATVDG